MGIHPSFMDAPQTAMPIADVINDHATNLWAVF
jgi:hypothetical protein